NVHTHRESANRRIAQVKLVAKAQRDAVKKVGRIIAIIRDCAVVGQAIDVHVDRPPLELIVQSCAAWAEQAVHAVAITLPNWDAGDQIYHIEALDIADLL